MIFLIILVLVLFAESNAKLNHCDIAKKLNISEKIASQIVDRIEYIDQINTQHAPYYPILSQFLKQRGYRIGCEIGVFTGSHSNLILQNTAVEKLYCIDSYIAPMNNSTMITEGFAKNYWQACWDTIYYYALNKLSIFGDRLQFLRLPAEEAAKIITNHSLDFIFIDGDHSYKGVIADCTNYYEKVRSGGIIAGDDYNIDDVCQAVQCFFGSKKLIVNVYPDQKRFWWVEVP